MKPPHSNFDQRGSASGKAAEAALRADPRTALWLADPLDAAAGKNLLKLQALADLQRMAIMPDVHASADVCVGTVLGTSSVVYPAAIGGDIGCGMSTIAFDTSRGFELNPTLAEDLLAKLTRFIDVMTRTPRSAKHAPSITAPATDRLSTSHLQSAARRDGERQLGTLGRGNHFVELQLDQQGGLWAMVHSGSRLMGQAVAGHYTTLAERHGVRSSLAGLDAATDHGRAYLADQAWCVDYARANRALLLASAAEAVRQSTGLRADWSTIIDTPHNLIRTEAHTTTRAATNGTTQQLIVHRKGAATAASGAPGLIPGSAGTLSVHTEGRGHPDSMASSSHGAGRVCSRSEAKALVSERDLHQQMAHVAYDRARASRLRDEAPTVYRDLRTVLQSQRDLIKVTRTLKPVVSFKAGG